MKIILNNDAAHVEKIRKALIMNDGYCPCAIEKNEDTKCMCKEFREQGVGKCHCDLYERVKE